LPPPPTERTKCKDEAFLMLYVDRLPPTSCSVEVDALNEAGKFELHYPLAGLVQ
jgi:hypothetical protein